MANPVQEGHVFVEFYTDAIEVKHRSEKEGRPIFEDRPFVRILIPGDKNNIIERPAKDADKQKYLTAWKNFERSESEGSQGTPLSQWPQITRAQLKEANYFEIKTVEQMAGLSDAHVQKLGMGFGDLRTKAKAYLEAAAGTADATRQAAEQERMQSRITELEEQLRVLSAARQPGRPRKEAVEA